MPTEVYLNVYDLFKGNSLLHLAGLGAYHSGIELYGREWSYGMLVTEASSEKQIFPDVSGVYATTPRKARGTKGELLNFRGAVLLGYTYYGERTVSLIIEQLQKNYLAKDYSAVHKNCHTFCDELAFQLTGRHLPIWINRLALIGECVPCLFPQTEEDLFGFPVANGKDGDSVVLPDDGSILGLDSVYDVEHDSKNIEDDEDNSQRNEVTEQIEARELIHLQQPAVNQEAVELSHRKRSPSPRKVEPKKPVEYHQLNNSLTA
jgi:hypothetical protein